MLQVAWSTLRGTDGRVNVYRSANGVDSPGGSFTLSFGDDYPTEPIVANATPAALEAALEALPTVGDVAVTVDTLSRSDLVDQTTYTAWLVEYTTLGTPPNLGDLPLLGTDGSFLTGTNVSAMVEEVSKGCCAVQLSVNGGQDYTSTTAVGGKAGGNTAAFKYQNRAVVRTILPSAGPAAGGTQISVSGAGFDAPSSTSSEMEAGLVSTEGSGSDMTCVFGGRLESPGVRLNSSVVLCNSPPVQHGSSRVVSVAVRWSGSVFPSLTTAAFSYYDEVMLGSLAPRRGSNAGGYSTIASVADGSFDVVGFDMVTCIVEVRLPSNITGSYTTRGFISEAEPVHKRAALVDTGDSGSDRVPNEAYSCEIPGIGDLFDGVSGEHWLEGDWGAIALVSLSGNGGVDRSSSLSFTYTARPSVVAVEPTLGGDTGGTPVIVRGRRLTQPIGGFNDGEVLCRFGHAPVVPARHLSDEAIECTTPQHTNVPAVLTVAIEGAAVFHETQQVVVRAPFPITMENIQEWGEGAVAFYLSSWPVLHGTWTLTLEGFETNAINATATTAGVSDALSELPNIQNVTVLSEESIIVSEPQAGLTWNETTYTVHFTARGGDIPTMTANSTNLRSTAFEDALTGIAEYDEETPAPALVPTPQVVVRTVEDGHDGDEVAREIQVFRVTRPALTAEVQSITVATGVTPTAEVRCWACIIIQIYLSQIYSSRFITVKEAVECSVLFGHLFCLI